MKSFSEILGERISSEFSHQVTSNFYVERLVREEASVGKVLDLGCGAGDSVELLEELKPDVGWIGVDIEESPINRLIGLAGRLRGLEPRSINAIKLLFCGQFVFWAKKPD